jgi:hypothetical protein
LNIFGTAIGNIHVSNISISVAAKTICTGDLDGISYMRLWNETGSGGVYLHDLEDMILASHRGIVENIHSYNRNYSEDDALPGRMGEESALPSSDHSHVIASVRDQDQVPPYKPTSQDPEVFSDGEDVRADIYALTPENRNDNEVSNGDAQTKVSPLPISMHFEGKLKSEERLFRKPLQVPLIISRIQILPRLCR